MAGWKLLRFFDLRDGVSASTIFISRKRKRLARRLIKTKISPPFVWRAATVLFQRAASDEQTCDARRSCRRKKSQ